MWREDADESLVLGHGVAGAVAGVSLLLYFRACCFAFRSDRGLRSWGKWGFDGCMLGNDFGEYESRVPSLTHR